MADGEERNVPRGRLGRFARMAALGVRTGAGLLLEKEGTSSARVAADVLGHLRGLAAKVGQMASYVDGVVPPEHRDAYEASMRALRASAPRSSSTAIRALVAQELGAPIDRLFVRFEDEPFASASIGQVHRATWHDEASGADLEGAVKVQHPGIADAVESDLSNAGVLEAMAGVVGSRRFETKKMLEVVRARFREELDYAREAESLLFFTRLHDGDPTVRVPRLVRERCAARVLTTELAIGATFEEAVSAPEAERRAWAETMWRFVFKGNLVGGRFNADPHPGNYVFQPDGRVVFLDYGCIQDIAEPKRAKACAMHRAAMAGDEAAFYRGVSALVDAVPGRMEDMARAYTRKCFEPLFNRPYRITRTYAASLVDDMKSMALAARKVPPAEFFTMPAEMLFINRLQFGFYSVLARLDVDVDYGAVEAEFL